MFKSAFRVVVALKMQKWTRGSNANPRRRRTVAADTLRRRPKRVRAAAVQVPTCLVLFKTVKTRIFLSSDRSKNTKCKRHTGYDAVYSIRL